MSRTVLVVDDEERIVSLIKAYLTQEGFRVVTAENGRTALFVARQEKPDLIILDIMMPEMDGYEFLRLNQKEQNVPVILLTAKIEETDKVLGLELGADDYVTKPFSPRELTARVRAVLRRLSKTETANSLFRAGELMLDKNGRLVKRGDLVIDLTPSEFDLLTIFMSNPGRAFSRLDLLEHLQGNNAYEGYERTIDVHVRNLRSKIEPDPSNPRYVETVYGIGYRFSIYD